MKFNMNLFEAAERQDMDYFTTSRGVDVHLSQPDDFKYVNLSDIIAVLSRFFRKDFGDSKKDSTLIECLMKNGADIMVKYHIRDIDLSVVLTGDKRLLIMLRHEYETLFNVKIPNCKDQIIFDGTKIKFCQMNGNLCDLYEEHCAEFKCESKDLENVKSTINKGIHPRFRNAPNFIDLAVRDMDRIKFTAHQVATPKTCCDILKKHIVMCEYCKSVTATTSISLSGSYDFYTLDVCEHCYEKISNMELFGDSVEEFLKGV